MNRRHALIALAASIHTASAAGAVQAQPAAGRRLRVACLVAGGERMVADLLQRVESGLAAAGLPGVEARAFVPDGEAAAATARSAEAAVAWGPDAILVPAPPLTLAARDATSSIPVVFFAVPDPDTLGLVRTLARPGGNLTGSGFDATALTLKRMELVHEVLPGAKRLAALFRKRPNTPWTLIDRIRREMSAAAQRLGVAFHEFDVGSAGLTATLASVERLRPDGVVMFGPYDWEPGGRSVDATSVLLDFERRTRILMVAEGAYAVRQGLTLGMYDGGSQLAAGVAQLARVLKGVSPAELPVQFPREYFVAVNRTAARAIGIALPPSVLIRANPVVD